MQCLVPGSSLSASLAAWMCRHSASRTLGLSPSSGKGPAFPTPVAFPAPSSGAFLLGPGVQILRKPLLSLLLPVRLSPALLALLSAPPSARMAVHEGMGLGNQKGASGIPHLLLGLLVGKEGNEGSFLGVLQFHVEIPGSVLCLPIFSLSWDRGLYSQIRVRPENEQGRQSLCSDHLPCFLSASG